MKIYTLYHFDGDYQRLSQDAMARVSGAVLYANQHNASEIVFVGGSFASGKSGASLMNKYAKEIISNNTIKLRNLPSICSKSNIAQIAKDTNSKNDIVVTSDYHVNRVKWLLGKSSINIQVYSAENIIISHGDDKLVQFAQNYLNSWKYRLITWKEKAVFACMRNSVCHYLMHKLRKYLYRAEK